MYESPSFLLPLNYQRLKKAVFTINQSKYLKTPIFLTKLTPEHGLYAITSNDRLYSSKDSQLCSLDCFNLII